jgi:DNA-binding response OmpR family regulator
MNLPPRPSSQFLIVEDDPGIGQFLVTYLRQQGHSAESITDGFETATWLAHNDCEVIIVDLKMPKVDGITLTAFIRDINVHVPIIVFTGMGYDEQHMHAALRAGANGYVSKNLPIEQLYCVLQRVLAACQQRGRRQKSNRLQPVLAGAA